jgi:hypothetical protein
MGAVAEVGLAGFATALATGLGALPAGRVDARAVAWRPALLGATASAMTVVSVLGTERESVRPRRRRSQLVPGGCLALGG